MNVSFDLTVDTRIQRIVDVIPTRVGSSACRPTTEDNDIRYSARRSERYRSGLTPLSSDISGVRLNRGIGVPSRNRPSTTPALLERQHRLDRTSLVHRPVALGDRIERQREVEDIAWCDDTIEHVLQKVRQVGAYGCEAALEA